MDDMIAVMDVCHAQNMHEETGLQHQAQVREVAVADRGNVWISTIKASANALAFFCATILAIFMIIAGIVVFLLAREE